MTLETAIIRNRQRQAELRELYRECRDKMIARFDAGHGIGCIIPTYAEWLRGYLRNKGTTP